MERKDYCLRLLGEVLPEREIKKYSIFVFGEDDNFYAIKIDPNTHQILKVDYYEADRKVLVLYKDDFMTKEEYRKLQDKIYCAKQEKEKQERQKEQERKQKEEENRERIFKEFLEQLKEKDVAIIDEKQEEIQIITKPKLIEIVKPAEDAFEFGM